MNNALSMSSIEPIRDLNSEVEEQIGRQSLASDSILQSLALEQFHGDEVLALVLADVVNRADVRVIQSRGRSGFALKTLESQRIPGIASRNFSASWRSRRVSSAR